jgi:glutamyl-tRNA reductase
MERCPVCRARLNAPVCRRCGADFSQAEWQEKQAQQTVREALRVWQMGHIEPAAVLLQQSLQQKHEEVVEQLLECLLQQLLHQAIQHLKQDNVYAAKSLCERVLAIKFVPLAAALQGFLLRENAHY